MTAEPVRLPRGVRDFLPDATTRRRALAEALLALFERWGYDRIITPAVEYADVLERGLGAGTRAQTIRFVEAATGQVAALRPDITPQVARLAATRLRDVPGPLRLCYEGGVLRLTPGARGQRELIQAGVELIDAPAPLGDAEAIALADAVLATLAPAGVRSLDLGHVGFARAALAAIDDVEARAEVAALVAKKDTGAVSALLEQLGVRGPARKLIEALPSLYGAPAAVLKRARALGLDDPARRALAELERALAHAEKLGVSSPVTFDLGELRGFEYYTGVRLAGYLDGVGEAALAGGRYDDLLGRYGRPAPAIGFSVDVERVAEAQQAAARARGDEHEGKRGIGLAGPSEIVLPLARVLRAAGVRVAVDVVGGAPADRLEWAREARLDGLLIVEPRGARLVQLDGAQLRVPGVALAAARDGDGGPLAREVEAACRWS